MKVEDVTFGAVWLSAGLIIAKVMGIFISLTLYIVLFVLCLISNVVVRKEELKKEIQKKREDAKKKIERKKERARIKRNVKKRL